MVLVGFFIMCRVVNLTLLEIFCMLVHIDVNASCQILEFTNNLYRVEVQCLFFKENQAQILPNKTCISKDFNC